MYRWRVVILFAFVLLVSLTTWRYFTHQDEPHLPIEREGYVYRESSEGTHNASEQNTQDTLEIQKISDISSWYGTYLYLNHTDLEPSPTRGYVRGHEYTLIVSSDGSSLERQAWSMGEGGVRIFVDLVLDNLGILEIRFREVDEKGIFEKQAFDSEWKEWSPGDLLFRLKKEDNKILTDWYLMWPKFDEGGQIEDFPYKEVLWDNAFVLQ